MQDEYGVLSEPGGLRVNRSLLYHSPRQINATLSRIRRNALRLLCPTWLGVALIARFETEDPNALVGLPLIKLTEMLANEGLDVLG